MGRLATVNLFEGSPHIFLATPTYDGKVGQAYTIALAQSIILLASKGVGVTYANLGGDCHVDDARNSLVRDFMESKCDSMIFLDADVGWRAEDLLELALSKPDFVAGVYPKKTQFGPEEYPVWVEPGTTLQANAEGLVEVHGVPTGFLKMSRNCLEIMHKDHGERKHFGQAKEDPKRMPITILFERTYENGFRWSGDYGFCRKWMKSGGKIYVNPEWTFVHEGEKQWTGQLGKHWRDTFGVTKAIEINDMTKAITQLRDGTAGLETMGEIYRIWDNPYAATPDMLFTLMLLARSAKGPILECGSGISSLVMALSTDQTVHAFEHSPVWAQYLENKCRYYGINNLEIHCEPLQDYGAYEWYSYPTGLPDFALVVCDGPPSTPNDRPLKGGRSGLLELKDKIKDAQFVFDDAGNGHGSAVHELIEQLGLDVKIFGQVREYAVSIPAVSGAA